MLQGRVLLLPGCPLFQDAGRQMQAASFVQVEPRAAAPGQERCAGKQGVALQRRRRAGSPLNSWLFLLAGYIRGCSARDVSYLTWAVYCRISFLSDIPEHECASAVAGGSYQRDYPECAQPFTVHVHMCVHTCGTWCRAGAAQFL